MKVFAQNRLLRNPKSEQNTEEALADLFYNILKTIKKHSKVRRKRDCTNEKMTLFDDFCHLTLAGKSFSKKENFV